MAFVRSLFIGLLVALLLCWLVVLLCYFGVCVVFVGFVFASLC